VKRAKGTGTIAQHGYIVFGYGGQKTYEHIRLAEKAIGKKLPAGAEVHHWDGDGTNNDPSNLVICPDHSYHMLLHSRQRAMEACGNPNFRRCWICGGWSDPTALKFKKGRPEAYHAACWARYQVDARARRKAAAT
jgi:hypothetical protein